MHIRIRVKRLVALGLLLALAGGGWLAVAYLTDSATLSAAIRREVPKYLPGTRLDIGHVQGRLIKGEVILTHVALWQSLEGASFLAARLPWTRIQLDADELLNGKAVLREVVVAQPTIRLRRRRDGTWNLQGLVAQPWPGPQSSHAPPILIQNGTVELSDGESAAQASAILRDVALRVEPAAEGRFRFEGSARGDVLDRVSLQGTFDPATGRAVVRGDVARLVISDALRQRLPPEVRALGRQVGLSGGEVDVRLDRLVFDPAATPRVRYEASGRLRSGVWDCPKLPFRIDNLAAGVSARDGVLTIERAEGYNGSTTVRAEGTVGLDDPGRAAMDLRLDVIDLELDQRLRGWTPPEFAPLWDEYQPAGRVSLALHTVRAEPGGPAGFGLTVDCHDVAMTYKFFPYPLDHVRGRLTWEGSQIRLDLKTLVGGKPLRAKGTIDRPGKDAHVRLDFSSEGFPIDEALFRAIPPDIRKVVREFNPSGTVRGTTRLDRLPPAGPDDPPEGRIRIDSYLDLDERCAMKWAFLPYPVMNMTGRLELHPDHWVFKDIRGSNGQAEITGSGRVDKMPGSAKDAPVKVALRLNLDNLPFDDQLRRALPPAWEKTWGILNPSGASNVAATIEVVPGRPDLYHLEIDPRPNTMVRLKYRREPRPGVDPGGTFELPMEDVGGRFVFHNGTVTMSDVNFLFHSAAVQFERGHVVVEDSGRFQLGVGKLWVKNFRLESVRPIMPPIMADFARRLDDGRPLTLRGDLGLGWDGGNHPVRCRWSDALVVFNDNTIQAGLPLEHVQGQLEKVAGSSDGDGLEASGILRLASVSLLGQQVTQVESPFRIDRGEARLEDVRGKLLGGDLFSKVTVGLDATPRYAASVVLNGADLQRYTRTVHGKQTFRGLVFGRLDLNGLGNDTRTLQGTGEAHIKEGDLGELPVMLRLFNFLKLDARTKTAFDSADLAFTIQNGETFLDPIKLTGNTFSLQGRGRLDVRGDLDLRLQVLYGRDRMHLPIISDAMREASRQIFTVRVQGTPSYPKFKLEALPQATELLKALGNRREARGRG